MEEPHVTEPGQTVTSDIQAAMMNSSDIFVAVPGASGWIVKNLTENFGGGNLSPVVARRGKSDPGGMAAGVLQSG